MAASPQVVNLNPLYLNARSGIYTAQELRKPKDDEPIGPGVQDIGSFKVVQRAAGLDRSVDVGAAGILNKAYVRGSTVTDQGLYRVDSIGLVNLDIAAADPTNPRIDQIYLCVEDQQHAGANNQATARVVTGTATGGATLDNRTGVGAAPAGMSSILLADILMPAAAANVPTANIRDRRLVGNIGSVPWLGSTGTQVDMVAFEPHFGHVVSGVGNASGAALSAGIHDNLQSAAAFWLPRRITAARIRFGYQQGATANAGNYALWVADASGRIVAATVPTAFAGGANVTTAASVAFISPFTFEEGWYYVGIGIGAMTAVSSVVYPQVFMSAVNAQGRAVPYPNIGFRAAAGGTTVPTTILAFGDISTIAGAQLNVSVPLCALSAT